MASMNKVLILGNLGSDPELKVTPGGQPVANFNVATNDVWNDKQGNRQERTEWHRIVVWGRQAEHCHQYLKKGRTVFIEGRIQSRQWEDKQGQKRTTTEIVANNVQFIGGQGGPGRQGADEPQLSEPPARDAGGAPAIADEDVPF
jgi:single-strand DNA-binding protein